MANTSAAEIEIKLILHTNTRKIEPDLQKNPRLDNKHELPTKLLNLAETSNIKTRGIRKIALFGLHWVFLFKTLLISKLNKKELYILVEMEPNLLVEMQSCQFPFGIIQNIDYVKTQKIYVQKKVQYRNEKQKILLENKISILKKLYHRNIINVRHVQELPAVGYHIYYNYVPFALEKAFQEIGYETFKQLHRQIIHLAIHLAKNYILTSFNPNRCGVVFIDGQFIIKYYLPLNEIVLTDNIAMLQRSVQLFKVQATHVLDTLCHNDVSEFNCSASEEFGLKSSLNTLARKNPIDLIGHRNRKLSNQIIKPQRRFSNTKSLKSLITNVKREKSQDSTNYSQSKISGLKQTLKLLKQSSQRKRNWQKQKQELKSKITLLRLRSSYALEMFNLYKKKALQYIQLLKIVVQHETRLKIV